MKRKWLSDATKLLYGHVFSNWHLGNVAITLKQPTDTKPTEWMDRCPDGIHPDHWFECYPSKWSNTNPRSVAACRQLHEDFAEIYISPKVKGWAVLMVLTHELVHVITGPRCGHTWSFGRVAALVGLRGKFHEQYPTNELDAIFKQIIATLGPYPEN